LSSKIEVFLIKPKFKRLFMAEIIPTDKIENKIIVVRGQSVILDRDLAELYGVETRVLIQAVRRNIKRFPEDFMFQLNYKEFTDLRSQFVISSWGGRRYEPYAFTENGVAMLSSVLNSEKAIEINIQIMRVFNRFKRMYFAYDELKKIIYELEKRQIEDKKTLSDDIQNLSQILFLEVGRLEKLITQPKKQIGFKKED
jgi:phage regulator Rha-like protein